MRDAQEALVRSQECGGWGCGLSKRQAAWDRDGEGLRSPQPSSSMDAHRAETTVRSTSPNSSPDAWPFNTQDAHRAETTHYRWCSRAHKDFARDESATQSCWISHSSSTDWSALLLGHHCATKARRLQQGYLRLNLESLPPHMRWCTNSSNG